MSGKPDASGGALPAHFFVDARLTGKDCTLRPSTRLVGMAIASMLGRDGRCWAARRRLCQMTGLGNSTVVRAVADLVEAGIYIKRIGGTVQGRKRDCMTFEVVRNPEAVTALKAEWSRGDTPQQGTVEPSAERSRGDTPQQGQDKRSPDDTPGVAAQDHQRSRGDTPQQTLNKPTEQKKKAVPRKRVTSLDRFQEFWDQYPHRDGRRRNRGKCEQIWKSKNLDAQADTIREAIPAQERHRQSVIASEGFAPAWSDPEGWLRNERWKDELPSTAAPASPASCAEPPNRLLTPEEKAECESRERAYAEFRERERRRRQRGEECAAADVQPLPQSMSEQEREEVRRQLADLKQKTGSASATDDAAPEDARSIAYQASEPLVSERETQL